MRVQKGTTRRPVARRLRSRTERGVRQARSDGRAPGEGKEVPRLQLVAPYEGNRRIVQCPVPSSAIRDSPVLHQVHPSRPLGPHARVATVDDSDTPVIKDCRDVAHELAQGLNARISRFSPLDLVDGRGRHSREPRKVVELPQGQWPQGHPHLFCTRDVRAHRPDATVFGTVVTTANGQPTGLPSSDA